MVMVPKRTRWMCPITREEVDPLAKVESDTLKVLKRKPYLPYNMSMLFWNCWGGILLIWNPVRVNVHIVNENAQGVHCLVELIQISNTVNVPWVMLGNFNKVISQSEKLGGRLINRCHSQLFANTMDACNLLDLGFDGPKYTWTNRRDNPLPPLGNKPFRFEPMWLMEPSFEGVVRGAWGRVCENLGTKLNQVGEEILDWNHNEFGNLYKRKKHVLARLKGTKNSLQKHPNSPFLFNLERSLQNDLLNILVQEECLWRMKSRIEWLSKGERNTAFFHKFVVIGRQNNRIRSLNNSVGQVFTTQGEIRDLVHSFFTDLYSSNQPPMNPNFHTSTL
ncbi:uncharacterized protein [Spinacia oleracea]|uniref:DUF4283 domain-containing protein n=1 Tax=Spinacia oleracea TaxID=3562 RepID=A0ABM3R9H1_SPIOL|nr:uncharacterized protein LOC130467684 [Spinacia oleracea]